MFIPGILISICTFPGVALHEWAHKFFCDRVGVRVLKVVYFQFASPVGYVTHELPSTFKQTFWISMGPLIVNSLAGIALAALSAYFTREILANNLLLWLTISVGMHSFPSDHDASHILTRAKSRIGEGASAFYYAAYPLFGLVWLSNKLRFFWFDLFYAAGLLFIGESLVHLLVPA